MWTQVQSLFERASNTEVVNKPNSEWIASFARTSNEVLRVVETCQDAYKVSGIVTKVSGGNLVLEAETGEFCELPVAFKINDRFLRYWLGSQVTALVINGYATKLWMKALFPDVFTPLFGGKQEYVKKVVEFPEPQSSATFTQTT